MPTSYHCEHCGHRHDDDESEAFDATAWIAVAFLAMLAAVCFGLVVGPN